MNSAEPASDGLGDVWPNPCYQQSFGTGNLWQQCAHGQLGMRKKLLRKLTSFSLMHRRSNVVTVKHFICRDMVEQSCDVILVKTARKRHLAPGRVIFKLGRHTWSAGA